MPVASGRVAKLFEYEEKRRERLEKAQADKVKEEEEELQKYRKVADPEHLAARLALLATPHEAPQGAAAQAEPVYRTAAEAVHEEEMKQKQKVKELSRHSPWMIELEVEENRKVRAAEATETPRAMPTASGVAGRLFNHEWKKHEALAKERRQNDEKLKEDTAKHSV